MLNVGRYSENSIHLHKQMLLIGLGKSGSLGVRTVYRCFLHLKRIDVSLCAIVLLNYLLVPSVIVVFFRILVDPVCCLTNVQHRSLIFQAHLWDVTLEFWGGDIYEKPLASQGYHNSLLLPRDPPRWGQMATTMRQLPAVARTDTRRHSPAPRCRRLTRSCTLSSRSNIHLNCAAPVWVRQGFEVGHVGKGGGVVWPGGGALNGFHCLWFLAGGEKKHTHTHTWSLQQAVVALCEGIPTCDRACETGGGMCEMSVREGGGGAAAQRGWGNGPAVQLISPMGPPAGKACLIWYTCATSCLSRCLASWRLW